MLTAIGVWDLEAGVWSLELRTGLLRSPHAASIKRCAGSNWASVGSVRARESIC